MLTVKLVFSSNTCDEVLTADIEVQSRIVHAKVLIKHLVSSHDGRFMGKQSCEFQSWLVVVG